MTNQLVSEIQKAVIIIVIIFPAFVYFRFSRFQV